VPNSSPRRSNFRPRVIAKPNMAHVRRLVPGSGGTIWGSGDTLRISAAEVGPAESKDTIPNSSASWSRHRYRQRPTGPLGRVRMLSRCNRSRQ
jgi:hypothetical protein